MRRVGTASPPDRGPLPTSDELVRYQDALGSTLATPC